MQFLLPPLSCYEQRVMAGLPLLGTPLSRGRLFWSISSAIEKENQEHLFKLSWDTAKGGGLGNQHFSPPEQMIA